MKIIFDHFTADLNHDISQFYILNGNRFGYFVKYPKTSLLNFAVIDVSLIRGAPSRDSFYMSDFEIESALESGALRPATLEDFFNYRVSNFYQKKKGFTKLLK